jgi:hypothetical protein
MRKVLFLSLVLPFFIPTAAIAEEGKPAVDQGPATFGLESNVTEISAKVVAIDHKNRIVTLEGPEGNTLTTKVDDDVENLDKVKNGDMVDIQLYEALAWSLKKAGQKEKPTTEKTQTVLTAKANGKPIKVETDKVTIIATIQKVDKKKETVTLKGPEGKVSTIKVKNPKNLEGVAKGDQVEISYTESVAFTVKKK